MNTAFDIVNKRATEDEEWKRSSEITADTLISLLKICLEKTPFHWNKKYWEQIYGTSMGNPLSMFIAGVMMEHIDDQIQNAVVQKTLPPFRMWYREVDDILTQINEKHIETYIKFINKLHDGMSFSHELPTTQIDTMNIPFIGVQITWNKSNGKCTTSVYRHPAWSAVYLHFDSNNPLSHKAGCVNTLLQRAHDICLDKSILDKEISFIIDILNIIIIQNILSNAV